MRFEDKPVNNLERLLFMGLLTILGLSLYFKPISYYQADWRGLNIPNLSVFHYFGLHGPTCGLTRSFVNLAHGRLVDGFLANFMGPLVFLSFLLAFIYLGYRFLGGKKKFKLNLGLKSQLLIIFIIFSAFIISWIIRMLTHLS